jgi:hypothetical protein
LLKVLCQERELRQKDPVASFGTESIVSEVFAGKRRLQTKHVTGLAGFFPVSSRLAACCRASMVSALQGAPYSTAVTFAA